MEKMVHITNLLLDFLDKFGSQLIEDRVHVEPPEPIALELWQAGDMTEDGHLDTFDMVLMRRALIAKV